MDVAGIFTVSLFQSDKEGSGFRCSCITNQHKSQSPTTRTDVQLSTVQMYSSLLAMTRLLCSSFKKLKLSRKFIKKDKFGIVSLSSPAVVT